MTKLAITIDLNELERLMKQYVAEELAGDQFLLQQMQLGHFLLWLTRRRLMKEGHDEQTQTTPTDSSDEQVRHPSRFDPRPV